VDQLVRQRRGNVKAWVHILIRTWELGADILVLATPGTARGALGDQKLGTWSLVCPQPPGADGLVDEDPFGLARRAERARARTV
jgi:hypothetical protein